jgi:hypothetical protein
MAASLHLEFLYSELILSQAIAKLTGETPDSLIETSRQILTVLLDSIARQLRTGHVNHILICDVCTSCHCTAQHLPTRHSFPILVSPLPPLSQRNCSIDHTIRH